MYKNGLNFPSFLIFVNDGEKISTLDDIRNQKNCILLGESEEALNEHILKTINTLKGFDLYPFLLNYFSYLIQSNFTIREGQIKTKFVKEIEFTSFLNKFKVDFLEVDNKLNQFEKIGTISKSVFYSEIYNLLYKRFAIKLAQFLSYSDSESSEFYSDFNTSFKHYKSYAVELDNTRPNLVKNYDFKKNYISSVYERLGTKNTEKIENKISTIENHTDRNILNTLRNVVMKSIVVKQGIDSKTRNKLFRPIYAELITAINGKVFDKYNQNSLTKEVKNFFLAKAK